MFTGSWRGGLSLGGLTLVICALCASASAAPPATTSAPGAPGAPTRLDTLREAAGPERIRAKHDEGAAASLARELPGTPLPADLHALVVARQWGPLWRALRDAKVKPQEQPERAFLMGYAARQDGAHAEAIATLKAVAEASPLLRDDAAALAMESAFSAKDWPATASLAAQVSADSSLRERALYLRAEALYLASKPGAREDAIKAFEAYLSAHDGRSHTASALARLAAIFEEQGEWDKAAAHHQRTRALAPLSGLADAADARLKALRPKLSAKQRAALKAADLSYAQGSLEARFDRHRSDEVVTQGQALLKSLKKGSTEHCEVSYLIGRSITKLRKHADSAPWYDRVLAQCDAPELQVKALYLGGKAHWNAGDRDAALAKFKLLWERFPKHSYADDAMFYSARILRERGDEKDARALIAQQVKAYPDGDMASDAHWLVVRSLIAKDDHAGVIAHVASLTDPQENDLYSRGRLTYFAARAREALGEVEQARAMYRQIALEHPLGYYAMLAVNRQARLAQAPGEPLPQDLCVVNGGALCAPLSPIGADAPPSAPLTIPDTMRQREAFQRGGVFLRLGLIQLAERELRTLRGQLAKSPEQLWALAALLDAAGAHPLAHDIPRRSISGWQDAWPTPPTRWQWEIAYPRPFHDKVQSHAAKRALPEALVYAIMREESGFNPGIESWANARGLLQLMASTAKTVAAREGMKGFTADTLFDPESNIQLGTAYMKELHGQLAGHPALIIAGYNGGYGNVSRWLRERGSLPLELWVEDIPYGQTRDYTKRVLTSFWTYSWLYGDQRAPNLPDDLSKVL